MRLIIFDWDGTLMDSEAAIVGAMSNAYRDESVREPPYQAIRAIIGLSLDHAIRELTPHLAPADVKRIGLNYRRHYASMGQRPVLFPGVRETLVALQRSGYYLAVATGKSRMGLQKALEETGLDDLFVTTRTADQTEPKPSPSMLHEILLDLDIPAAEALMIGDTEFDLRMARSAGTQLAGVSYGAHPVERLLPYNPAFLIDRFDELPERLHELGTTAHPDTEN